MVGKIVNMQYDSNRNESKDSSGDHRRVESVT